MKILRPEVQESIQKSGTDFFGIIDQGLFMAFNITEEELQFIHDNATDKELETFVDGLGQWMENPTFTEIRKALEVRNKYLELKNKR